MDQAVTRWLNALAENNLVLDAFVISVTQFGIPVLVLLVILQWWSRAEQAWRQGSLGRSIGKAPGPTAS